MKKILPYIAVIALAGIAAWQIASLLRTNSADKETLDYYNSIDLDGMVLENISAAFTGIPLATDDIKVENYRRDTLSLADILATSDSPVVIARYSAAGCRPCIVKTMNELQSIAEADSTCKIVVLMADVPHRDLNVFGAQYNRRYDFYRAQSFPLDIDEEITPAILTILPSGTITAHRFIRRD